MVKEHKASSSLFVQEIILTTKDFICLDPPPLMRMDVKYKSPLSSDHPSRSDHLRRCHHDGRTAEGRLICRWTGIIGETGDGRTDDADVGRVGVPSRISMAQ